VTADINNFGTSGCTGNDGGGTNTDLVSYEDWNSIVFDSSTESTFLDGVHNSLPEITIDIVVEIKQDQVDAQNQEIQNLDDSQFVEGVDPVQVQQELADDFTELSTLVASSDSDDLMAAAALAQQISDTVTDSISDPIVQQEILEALDALSGGLEIAADTGDSIHASTARINPQQDAHIQTKK